MSRRKQTRAIQKVVQKFFQQLWQLSVSVTKAMFQWLLRTLMVTRHRRRRATPSAGFVLPTVVLLLLVVSLVIAALLFRTGSRTNQVISERQQQVIYNAATPAIERAKAKLEYLFKGDDRLPNTVPSEEILMSMLQNDGSNGIQALPGNNPYKFPDETQLDINGGGNDSAWSYPVDADGDPTTGSNGKETTVAYSIIFKARNPDDLANDPRKVLTDKQKAEKLFVRNGPITITESVNPKCKRLNVAPESGWDLVSQAALRKTFQVSAVVVSTKSSANRTLTTLEFQQDRELARANKWGAWFRYDMHIHPLPAFRWNGAIHTEGSLYLGGSAADSVQGYLISSPDSCLYDPPSNSEVSVGRVKDDQENITFAGQVFNGTISGNPFSSATFHIHGRPATSTGDNVVIDTNKDSVGNGTAAAIALDPVVLFTEDRSTSAGGGSNENRSDEASEWITRERLKTNTRIIAKTEEPPYVDDTYRADDRLGPKPKYRLEGLNNSFDLGSTLKNGVAINGTGLSADQKNQLTNNTPPANDLDLKTLGLDGYWERRARAEGSRIIVGPRLELGNAYGWTNNDPLYPPNETRTHQDQQRRTWRDNLAAVQATTLYHYTQNTGDVPIACLSTTAHAGTQQAIELSRNFNNANGQLQTNFFIGKGTNGWEYNAPPTGLGGDWDTAIKNLAKFAGEKEGAFPPTIQGSNSRVYPHSYLSMWGNFSNLRRAIEEPANNPVSGQISIADQSYRYSAACTMGILARNIVDIQSYDYGTNNLRSDTDTGLSSITFPVNFPADPRPDNFIALIANPDQREKARIIYLQEQIKRDRQRGFAPVTPATYKYTVQAVTNFQYAGKTYTKADGTTPATEIDLGCDFTANNYFGLGNPSGNENNEKTFIRLATSLCSAQPKFPSLYYLFPTQIRPDRKSPDSATDSAEPYISQTSSISGSFDQLNPAQIALNPKGWGSWQTPTSDSAGSRPNTNRIIRPDNNQGFVSFLDSVMFDGRELMPLRVLDIDLELLRNKDIGSDKWLSRSGVVYAFREDAVREDGIARPANSTNPANAKNPNSPTDPQLETNGISRKPVDFYPDPDRRPYGFRLRNGADLKREQSNPRGITFVSDNPVAIQGDFNLHTQQEFTQTLGDDFDTTAFYNNRTDLNESFASLTGDNWRPAEILADAITILSKDFQDGSVDRGIRRVTGNSFGSINAPRDDRQWIREDGSASNGDATHTNASIPIRIDRNGKLFSCSSFSLTPCTATLYTNYFGFGDQSQKIDSLNDPTADGTRVNAILVSGIVPARANQGNGGMHNFPRLLEDWTGIPLRIAGSFIQLNFSTYATGPYEQDDWEPSGGSDPDGGVDNGEQNTYYYDPPKRVYGYDVGLQYAPAGPLSKRFITSETPRSEFYEEPKANDPYICNLRRAIAGQSETVESSSQVQQECQS